VLGIEDPKDERFDVDFGAKIVENQEMIFEESFDPKNFRSELDTECSAQEVVAAIAKLKLAKASGHDEIVDEILKKGGKQVEAAVFLFVRKCGEKRSSRKNGDKKDTTEVSHS